MIYQYCCPKCASNWDVIKPVALYERDEQCPACKMVGTRQFVPAKIHLYGTSVQEAEYNPGLGKIVKNKAHRQELCKMMNVEEIGNEKPDTLHNHFEKVREEKVEKMWAEADKGWVGSEG